MHLSDQNIANLNHVFFFTKTAIAIVYDVEDHIQKRCLAILWEMWFDLLHKRKAYCNFQIHINWLNLIS